MCGVRGTYDGEVRCLQVLADTPMVKRPLEKPRRRKKDHMTMNQEVGHRGMGWNNLAQERVAGACECYNKHRVP
jgi:hypothetical protein